jgi:hypothetical protein
MNDEPVGAGPASDAGPAPEEGRSWRRIIVNGLAVVVALALVGVFLVLQLRDDEGGDDPGADGGTAATATATPSPDESEHGDDELPLDTDGNPIPPFPEPPPPSVSGRESLGAAPAGARETAEGFGRAFTNVSGGQNAWYTRLAVFLTPEKAAEYRAVPIEALPSGTLVKADVETPGNRVALAVLTYDSGLVLNLTLAHDGEKWQVTKIDRPGPNAGATK